MSADFSDDEEFFESIRRHEKQKASQFAALQMELDMETQATLRLTPNRNITSKPQNGNDLTNKSSSSTQRSSMADLPDEIRTKLYQADGEIAVLKAQLEQARSKEQEETNKLKQLFNESKKSMEEQINLLKFNVQKLEDEKKFLDNQIRSNYSKRRKVSENSNVTNESRVKTAVDAIAPAKPNKQRLIRVQNDTTLLTEYLWRLSINGSKCTTMEYLGKICLKDSITVHGLIFPAQLPISGLILEYLISKKDLRLDRLIEEFFTVLSQLINVLIKSKLISSVPFLLSLIHGILGFKPSAINKSTMLNLTTTIINIIKEFKSTLDSEDKDLFNYNKTPQYIQLEKFILIILMDILESIMILCNLHQDSSLSLTLYYDVDVKGLLNQFLPKNQEALLSIVQINIIYNIVEILNNFYEMNPLEELSSETIQTLINIHLLGIPIKENFRMFGLNRCIGNNVDFQIIDRIIVNTKFNNIQITKLIVLPNPFDEVSSTDDYEIEYHHEYHMLQLQLQVSKMIENYLINRVDITLLKNIDTVKIIIRLINLEQYKVQKDPRSKLILFRLKLITNFIRNLDYLFKICKKLNEIITLETLNELTIVLARIAFSSNENLSELNRKLYGDLRTRNYKLPITNLEIELKSRQLHNINETHQDKQYLAEIESYSANGLEVPYDNETIELSREILGYCIDNEVADNLYMNMGG